MTAASSFNPINMKSVTDITGNNKEALVFGTTDTGWEWMQSQLQTKKDSPIQRVYNYVIGDDIAGHEEFIPPGAVTTLEGRTFTKITSGASKVSSDPQKAHTKTKRICKGALVNWALEVWRRKDSPAQIPLIFTVDIDGNKYPLTVENVLSKTKVMDGKKVNEIITHAEIRRLAKLCTDERIDKEVREAVRKNVQFVRLKKSGNELVVEKLPAPWEDPSWKEEFAKRSKLHTKVEKDYDWRKELNERVASEREKQAKVTSAPPASNSPKPVEPVKAQSTPSPVQAKSSPTSKKEDAQKAEERLLQGLTSMFGSSFKF